MIIQEIYSNYYEPSCISEYCLFAHDCRGRFIRATFYGAKRSDTDFESYFGMHIDEYIKRKTK